MSGRPAGTSAWAPLRNHAFRILWIASFVANIGTWMQTVGAQHTTQRARTRECMMEDLLSDGSDAGQDEVDAGEELFAVIVLGQLRRHLTRERCSGLHVTSA
jgi:Transmembrane secretion effector